MPHTSLRRAAFCAFAILVVALPHSASSSGVAEGATEYRVPMRDGTRLATNIFLPEGDAPWPTILARTPYGKDGRSSQGYKRYTDAGYAYVIGRCIPGVESWQQSLL